MPPFSFGLLLCIIRFFCSILHHQRIVKKFVLALSKALADDRYVSELRNVAARVWLVNV